MSDYDWPDAVREARREGAVEALREAARDLRGIESALRATEELILDAEDKPFLLSPTERRRFAIEDWLNERADALAAITQEDK